MMIIIELEPSSSSKQVGKKKEMLGKRTSVVVVGGAVWLDRAVAVHFPLLRLAVK